MVKILSTIPRQWSRLARSIVTEHPRAAATEYFSRFAELAPHLRPAFKIDSDETRCRLAFAGMDTFLALREVPLGSRWSFVATLRHSTYTLALSQSPRDDPAQLREDTSDAMPGARIIGAGYCHLNPARWAVHVLPLVTGPDFGAAPLHTAFLQYFGEWVSVRVHV